MIARRPYKRILAFIVLICFGQQCRLAVVAAQERDLVAGDEIGGCLGRPAESCRAGPQEKGGGTKSMSQESIQRRVRVYRVLGRRGRTYVECVVVEDIEKGQFEAGNSMSGGAAMRTKDAAMDRSDAFSVLNDLHNDALREKALRNDPRLQESWIPRIAADSIDDAVSQAEIRMKELMDWSRHGKVPSWAQEAKKRTNQGDRALMIRPALPGEGPSEEEIARMHRKVLDFGGGAKLRWRRLGRTPNGRRYDVLTFSGSDEVLISSTGVEVPGAKR